MPAFEIDPHLEPGGADAVVVGVVDIEHEIEGAARQPDSGDRDLLEGDLRLGERQPAEGGAGETEGGCRSPRDRKSTRLNSSHQITSYAVFCLKKRRPLSTLTPCRTGRTTQAAGPRAS